MRELDDKFKSAGIAVRFVAIGKPAEVARFCGKFGDPAWCVADPHKRTYKAMGFGDVNLLRLFTDADLKRRRDENSAAGFSQDWRNTKLSNGAQLPGAAVVDAGGNVRWIHRGKHPGDLPPMRDMLETAIAALKGSTGVSSPEA